MSSTKEKIDELLTRLKSPSPSAMPPQGIVNYSPSNIAGSTSINKPQLPASAAARPALNLPTMNNHSPISRPKNLQFQAIPRNERVLETEKKLKDIMQISGDIKVDRKLYKTDIKDMEQLEELGNGTCGHVFKMRHKPSGSIIAVKQMRRSGNIEENKRILMDIEVVVNSHDCEYIVQCLGCFITDSEVWICMELMDTCFDKLLKRLKQPIPEDVLGKVTVAVVEALSYLKDRHDVIHRDVKPSNILLDSKGNVKLCDFGISGRLVDSLAKTRQAGCAAYMAPERIEPDPKNPDYDVRADVWSLGITLVEMATGQFPYQNCKTDFEMLTKVIDDAPPTLPEDKNFSPEFRDFVKLCLEKDKRRRPKYNELKNHKFIKKYQAANVNVGEWYVKACQQVETNRQSANNNQNARTNSIRHFFTPHQKQPPGASCHTLPQQQQQSNAQNLTNGNNPTTSQPKQTTTNSYTKATTIINDSQPNNSDFGTNSRFSRLSAFQSNRDGAAALKYTPQRSYSPFQAYQNHIALQQQQQQNYNSSVLNRISGVPATPPTYRRATSATGASLVDGNGSRWRSPSASPLPLRSQFQVDDTQYNCGNTSPLVLQRFYHQQKQQQLVKEAEESGKKRFASYIKLQLGGDRSGRSSRHQSPEPPPRLNRGLSGENSPLTLRRNFLENHTTGSPNLPRRYVSPAPPMPPPRHLSESTSVPGSPQHFRARFHYTPEPQRRLFQNHDLS